MYQSLLKESNVSKASEPKNVYKVHGLREDSVDTSKLSKPESSYLQPNPHTDRVLEFFRKKNPNDSESALSYEDHTGKDPFE